MENGNFLEMIKGMESEMEKVQEGYDSIMSLSREIIRSSGKAVTLLHNAKAKEAKELIDKAYKLLCEAEKASKRFSYLLLQAKQELSEAKIFYAIKISGSIPSKKSVGINSTEAYILGLMDTIGELKREVLSMLMEKNVKKAKESLALMELIYDATSCMRFSDAVMPDFRRKQDVARILIENAGSDIVKFLA
ncbi:MAG: hypothetical protein QXD11_02460 [Candidatus Micrarchaeaceae archaeon]